MPDPAVYGFALLATSSFTLPLGTVFAQSTPPQQPGSTDQHSVRTLGALGTGNPSASSGLGVSDDGTVVVGGSVLKNDFRVHAYRWTLTGGMVDLGDLRGGNGYSIASAVNADGSVVMGDSSISADAYRAFRWTQATGMVDLGAIGVYGGQSASFARSFARGVSRGAVVVGGSTNALTAYDHAFRWKQSTGMQDLGTLGIPYGYSTATAVNDDGNIIVGGSATPLGTTHAFVWNGGTMTDLGTLLGGIGYSEAFDVSPDGLFVVGSSNVSGTLDHAFRWSLATGMVDLGALGGGNSIARAVSADGSIVIGNNATLSGERAFRWSLANSIQDLNTLLATAGVDMTGVTLTTANGLSSNGEFITGSGYFSANAVFDQAYIVRVRRRLHRLNRWRPESRNRRARSPAAAD